MTVADLRKRYAATVDAPPRVVHRAYMARRLAWKLQEQRVGGLSETCARTLAELTRDLDPLDLAVAAARGASRRRKSLDGSASEGRSGGSGGDSLPTRDAPSTKPTRDPPSTEQGVTPHEPVRPRTAAGGREGRRSPRGDLRIPVPGACLSRVYRERQHIIMVLDGGFEYAGRRYRSLSAIAKVITGAHWNGMLFFGLIRQRRKR